ncbi:MAG: lipopolysaccharide transport periplasmic protein LptA, partial [Methylococcales bacterium]|nr:lipopolysaccharide transport periplasmic protein LptA [Methylococcales bacterium]
MNLIKLFTITFLLTVGHTVFALESDAEQPVYIDSNTAVYNDKTAISIYTGDVVTIQGSLNIKSDKLVVYIKDGEIEKMVFTGKPAKFKQLPSVGADMIYGEGLTGEYYPSEDKLILIEEAVVSQGNNRSASRLIVYDSKNSLIRAGDKSSDDKRVHSVFKSKTKKQDNK